MSTILSKFKAWVHKVTAPEPATYNLSTSKRTAPFSFPLEISLVPRLPPRPEGVSDQEFQEALDMFGPIFNSDRKYGVVTYWPRQKDMTIEYPETEIYSYGKRMG
jgi:hypothetical protein